MNLVGAFSDAAGSVGGHQCSRQGCGAPAPAGFAVNAPAKLAPPRQQNCAPLPVGERAPSLPGDCRARRKAYSRQEKEGFSLGLVTRLSSPHHSEDFYFP